VPADAGELLVAMVGPSTQVTATRGVAEAD
jgi:hypothetical protein